MVFLISLLLTNDYFTSLDTSTMQMAMKIKKVLLFNEENSSKVCISEISTLSC